MNGGYYIPAYSQGMKVEIAVLIIMFPLYLIFSWLVNKDISRDSSKAELGLRKWLTSLTLFLTGLALAIDLISLILIFLNGEITSQFVFKMLTILIVAGAIFAYYLQDIRGRFVSIGNSIPPSASVSASLSSPTSTQKHSKIPAICGWAAGTVVIASLVASFAIVGSPFTARKEAFDAERISDLQNIQSQIISYWQEKDVLPTNLSALNDSISGYTAPSDPETLVPYGYLILAPVTIQNPVLTNSNAPSTATSAVATSEASFELCATFDLSSTAEQVNGSISSSGYYDLPTSQSDNWAHAKGQTCFTRMIDPLRYPLNR
jgi:type II secretory pathway pseudopilin PulG